MPRVQRTVLEIGPRLDLRTAEPLVVDAFVAQRRRLLATARTLPDDEWTRPSRCAEWDARQLLVHVLGATDACRATLTGEHSVFGGAFDPNSSPNAFVDRRADDPVAVTLDELDTAITRAAAAVEATRAEHPALQVTAVWGEDVDWRLFVTHMFWDSWIHERDLLLPLGRGPEVIDSEARLATAYALHCAAIMLGLLGHRVDVTLGLDGPGHATYRATADGTNVTVSVGPLDRTRRVNGAAVAVTDAIAGRGVELGEVLDAPDEVVAELAQVGAFLRGQVPPPVISPVNDRG